MQAKFPTLSAVVSVHCGGWGTEGVGYGEKLCLFPQFFLIFVWKCHLLVSGVAGL